MQKIWNRCQWPAAPTGLLRRLSTEQDNEKHYKQMWYRPVKGQDTGIRIYNCVAKRQVPLILPSDRHATWYTCGPTVYDSSHLGHASCYVKLDIIQRLLRNHFHVDLITAMNITDIDDKIIKRSLDTGRPWEEISRQYETEFWDDMKRLNVLEPNLKMRVTEQMPKIIAFIEKIVENKFAYVGKDKSVYFDLKRFPIYGKLQKVNITGSDDEADVKDVEESLGKSAVEDFALWKAQKAPVEPHWPAPWGNGRPGWHIECSALASMIFGDALDFHAGGLDLRFPHHENEEAQCCVYHDTKQWVNYWLHTGQLHIKGQKDKMSKSLKNTVSIDDMLKQYTSDEFRMACILSNYRNSVDYGSELMLMARNTLQRFHAFHSDCLAYMGGKKPPIQMDSNAILSNLNHAKSQLEACYKSDFDTARAMTVLLEEISSLSRNINSSELNVAHLITASCIDTVAAVDCYVKDTLSNLGFQFGQHGVVASLREHNSEVNVNDLLEDILQTRQGIRKRASDSKNKELFQVCDDLRNCLQRHGIAIKDHSHGSSWSFANFKK